MTTVSDGCHIEAEYLIVVHSYTSTTPQPFHHKTLPTLQSQCFLKCTLSASPCTSATISASGAASDAGFPVIGVLVA